MLTSFSIIPLILYYYFSNLCSKKMLNHLFEDSILMRLAYFSVIFNSTLRDRDRPLAFRPTFSVIKI